MEGKRTWSTLHDFQHDRRPRLEETFQECRARGPRVPHKLFLHPSPPSTEPTTLSLSNCRNRFGDATSVYWKFCASRGGVIALRVSRVRARLQLLLSAPSSLRDLAKGVKTESWRGESRKGDVIFGITISPKCRTSLSSFIPRLSNI